MQFFIMKDHDEQSMAHFCRRQVGQFYEQYGQARDLTEQEAEELENNRGN